MWHHSPKHIFLPDHPYIVTAGTLYKRHYFRSDEHLKMLESALTSVLLQFDWILEAWAVFSNHYHFIARSPRDATTLVTMVKRLHALTSLEVNRLDGQAGRGVWYQYWDTCLTYQRSYLARFNYVNNNPVHHGLVKVASQYPYCSAAWFEQNADPAFRRKVESFRWDKISIVDDF